jgi:hypothetical protein
MVFSERQKLAEEIIFLSEKRGMSANGFGLGEGGGFLAQKFNRRTALDPTTKLSYVAQHPPLRQTAVSRSVFIFYTSQIDLNLFFLLFSVHRFGLRFCVLLSSHLYYFLLSLLIVCRLLCRWL